MLAAENLNVVVGYNMISTESIDSVLSFILLSIFVHFAYKSAYNKLFGDYIINILGVIYFSIYCYGSVVAQFDYWMGA